MRGWLLAPLVVLAAGTAATLPAAAAARSTCQRLKGADLAPARTVKLVRRPNADAGSDLRGCVLPRGRVRTIASSSDQFTTTYGYAIRQVAGRIVAVDSTYSSQYAYSNATRVWDLLSGRSYPVAYVCSEIGGGDCGGTTTAPALFVTKLGRAVAAIGAGPDRLPAPGAEPAPSSVTIATFDPAGVRRDLDSGPLAQLAPASLALAGTTAYWTHGGRPRSADISRAD
jgi:hypothetical protein